MRPLSLALVLLSHPACGDDASSSVDGGTMDASVDTGGGFDSGGGRDGSSMDGGVGDGASSDGAGGDGGAMDAGDGSSTDGGATLACNGRDDCVGQICCGQPVDGGVTLSCVDRWSCGGDGGSFEVCGSPAICSNKSDMCCPLERPGFSGFYCVPFRCP